MAWQWSFNFSLLFRFIPIAFLKYHFIPFNFSLLFLSADREVFRECNTGFQFFSIVSWFGELTCGFGFCFFQFFSIVSAIFSNLLCGICFHTFNFSLLFHIVFTEAREPVNPFQFFSIVSIFFAFWVFLISLLTFNFSLLFQHHLIIWNGTSYRLLSIFLYCFRCSTSIRTLALTR